MNNDVTEVAMWQTQYYLTMETGDGGSVSPSSGWYDEESPVTIFATPDAGYSFSSWIGFGMSGSYSGPDSPRIITMSGPKTETAVFQEIPTLDIVIDGFSDDWEGIEPVAVDPANDTSTINQDLREVYLYIDDETLYLMIQTENDPLLVEGWIDLGFYTDFTDMPGPDFRFSGSRTSDSFPIQNEVYEVFEYQIPLENLGSPSSMILTVSSQAQNGTEDASDTIRWINITRTEDSVLYSHNPLYLMQVVSDFGEVHGEGIFEEGLEVTFSVSPSIQLEEEGVRHVFRDWRAITSIGYNGSDNPAKIRMGGRVIEVAEWDTEYYLTISSEVTVEGEGWYPEGSTVQLEAESPRGFLIRSVFKRWIGDVDPDSHSVPVVMDEPKTVVAEWATDYSQVILLGGVSAVLGVGGVFVTRERRRKGIIISMIARSEEIVALEDVAKSLDISEVEVRAIIEEAISGGVLVGQFSNERRTFITDDAFKKIMKDKLKDEQEA